MVLLRERRAADCGDSKREPCAPGIGDFGGPARGGDFGAAMPGNDGRRDTECSSESILDSTDRFLFFQPNLGDILPDVDDGSLPNEAGDPADECAEELLWLELATGRGALGI